MTPNEYQNAALRTANTNYDDIMRRIENGGEPLLRLFNGALGLSGESGEVSDIVKKHIFQGHALDVEHICKELGDCAWYMAVASAAIGFPLEKVMQANIDKLRARYPDGFEAERSLHRKDGDV